MPTAPPSITTLPAAPDPNNRTTFNSLAYPWSAALPTFGTQVSAVATNVKANADEAEADAVATAADRVVTTADRIAAAASASTATTQAGNALTSANNATTQAGIATTKAGEANASAIAAAASAASVAGGPVASVNGRTGVVTGVQDSLVSGTSIRTINGTSILGSGNLDTAAAFVDTSPVVKGSSDATKQIRFEVDGLTTATTRVLTVPDADMTLVGAATTQTLTNKTLTAPNIGTPTAGDLSSCTADGTNAVGFRHIPQISQSAAYTLVLTDAGKHILHPSADTTARTFTIPANASVAFSIGTAVTFVNQNAGGVITIAITTDTMRLAGAGTTGSRTLAANGVATAIKLTATEWIISGGSSLT